MLAETCGPSHVHRSKSAQVRRKSATGMLPPSFGAGGGLAALIATFCQPVALSHRMDFPTSTALAQTVLRALDGAEHRHAHRPG
jgi:hypothetical protein